MSTRDQDYGSGMQVGSVTVVPHDGSGTSISWPGPYNITPKGGVWIIAAPTSRELSR